MPITDSDLELARERIRERLGLPNLRRTGGNTLGINLMSHPLDHGCANLADARAYHERLAARGERDES